MIIHLLITNGDKKSTNNKEKGKSIMQMKTLFSFCLLILVTMGNFSFAENSKSIKHQDDKFYKQHPILMCKPEIGVDFGFTKTRFVADGSVEKLLNRRQAPVNAFVGFNLTEKVGLEIGYTETMSKHKDITLVTGDYAPGAIDIPGGEYQTYDTSVSYKRLYLGVKYLTPIKGSWSFYGSAGMAMARDYVSWENVEDSSGIMPRNIKNSRTYSITLRKNIPFVKLGLYYEINNHLSLRCLTAWFKSSEMTRFIPSREDNGFAIGIPTTIKNKNQMNYFIGLVYKL